jgi:hypothetical protein
MTFHNHDRFLLLMSFPRCCKNYLAHTSISFITFSSQSHNRPHFSIAIIPLTLSNTPRPSSPAEPSSPLCILKRIPYRAYPTHQAPAGPFTRPFRILPLNNRTIPLLYYRVLCRSNGNRRGSGNCPVVGNCFTVRSEEGKGESSGFLGCRRGDIPGTRETGYRGRSGFVKGGTAGDGCF